MLLFRQGVIIDCERRVKGSNNDVPSVPSNEDRYNEFQQKLRARGLLPAVNNYPWVWRGKSKPKTFLSKKPKRRKIKKETIPV